MQSKGRDEALFLSVGWNESEILTLTLEGGFVLHRLAAGRLFLFFDLSHVVPLSIVKRTGLLPGLYYWCDPSRSISQIRMSG